MFSLRLFLFGVPRVEREGQAVSIRRRKVWALLAYLAVTGQPHSRDALATMFWPENDQSSALANLRRDLSRLKRAVGDEVLDVDRLQVGLVSPAHPSAGSGQGVWLDVEAFKGRLAAVQAHGHAPGELCAECMEALTQAVSLYSDDFMAGFSLPDSLEFDEWQFFQAEGLRRSFGEALQRLVQWHTGQAEFEQGVEYARRWVALDPLHEEAQRQLMRLYAWSGQQAAAVRQYQECARLLEEELGVEPEPETVALYEAIRTRQLPPPDEAEKTWPTPAALAELAPQARYVLEERLAVGGYGEVYRGRDRLTDQPVAIKRLRPELVARDPKFLTRFVREGEALRRLDHPNIVKMLATFEHEGQHHIVMEYVPGGTLRDLLQEQSPLPLERTLDIALELADALARAHHLHVVHRDLKPGNVLLAADGTPRLTDFGMARLEREDTRLTLTGAIIGSPAYLSPEAARGEELDARSDVWSFGAMLFEMLSGHPPFEEERLTPLLVSILQEPVPEIVRYCPDLPRALGDLLRGMLAKERERRIVSMREVAAALEAIRGGRPDSVSIPERRGADQAHLVGQARESEGRRGEGAALPSPPHNLPHHATPFVGREEELADIRRLLREEPACRLLTLVGPGGIGKTRLALEAAEGTLDAFSDGVFFVPLASVGGIEFMVAAVAEAVDCEFSRGVAPKSQLLKHLVGKRLLLVADNLEHLLEGVDLFSEILSAAPQARLLVTSRERLHLQEEWIYEVQGLPCPEAVDDPADLQAYGAARLFVERARQADVNFGLSAEDVPALVRVCKLVDGMPLALELAAAWARSMSLSEIAREVERNLDFLSTSMRNVPERHRSLKVVFEQSWERLTDAEQEVLSRLSVFQGGCSREAAEVVAGATLPLLASLGDKSLLHRADSGRYEMHGLIHQFAAEQLAADQAGRQALQDRHCTYYGSFLEGRIPAMEGDRQREALAEVAVEIDNVRAGWRYALTHLRLDVLRAYHWGLGMFFWLRGWFEEARDTFEAAAEVLECEPDVVECQEMLVQILVSFSTHCQFLGQTEPAEAALKKGLAVAERLNRPALVAAVLDRQARLSAEQGAYVRARMLGARALSIYEELDDPVRAAHVLTHQGAVSLHLQEYETARRQLQASVARHRRMNKLPDLMMGLSQMARVLFRTGAYAEAQEYLEEVVAICERMNTPIHASVYNNLGQVAEAQGKYELAREHYLASLAYSERVRNEPRRGTPLAYLGNLARIAGDFEEAWRLLHEGLEIHRKYVSVREVARDIYLLGLLAQAEGDASAAQERFDDSYTLYEADENRHGMALALHGLGEVALGRDELSRLRSATRDELPRLRSATRDELPRLRSAARDELERARGYLKRALELAAGIGAHPVTGQILLGWARYRLARGETEEGLYLLAFVGAQTPAHHETRERARALWAERSAALAPGELAEIQSRAGGATLADVVARYLAAEAEPVLHKV
jgi:predicted ATPase/DNA-binding SARP family transcriptional activator